MYLFFKSFLFGKTTFHGTKIIKLTLVQNNLFCVLEQLGIIKPQSLGRLIKNGKGWFDVQTNFRWISKHKMNILNILTFNFNSNNFFDDLQRSRETDRLI